MIEKKNSFASENTGDILLEKSPSFSFDDGELFLTLSEITNQPIFICDNECNLIFANNSFANIVNINKAELVNHSLFNIIEISDKQRNNELKELQKGIISSFEIVGRIKICDSKELAANLIVTAIKGIGFNDKYFLGVMEDVTENFHLEEELNHRHKLETVEQISGGIIHDLNNNLMGIMCCAEIIRKQAKEKSLSEYANKMLTMAKRASELNISILNYIKRGKSIVKPCDLHKVIKESLSILEPALGPSYTYLFVPEAKNSIVECDSVLIENAIINLGINARDAMYKGGEIRITTSNIKIKKGENYSDIDFAKPGEYIAIDVKDHGVGIKEIMLDKIFEPYFTTKSSNKGTGLGLFIVDKVIDIHNGYIHVESKEYSGTTFTILLPLFTGKFEVQNSKKMEKVIKGKGTILLVDDEDLVRSVTEDLLAELGYKVISFGCTSNAISYYKSNYHKIDAVVLDMIMPLMTGVELFEVMKFINPEIKAALLTGVAFKEDTDALLSKGFKTILNKPINKQELSIQVSELVNA